MQQGTVDLPKLVQRRFPWVQVDGADRIALLQGSLVQVCQRMRLPLSVGTADAQVCPGAGFHLGEILAEPGIQLRAMGRQQADRQRVVEALTQALEHTT